MIALWTLWKAIRGRFGRYARSVAQPSRMNGDSIGYGNRR